MGTKEFKSFIYTAERNAELRRKIKNCNTFKEIIPIAKQYGFSISINDLNKDLTNEEEIEEWFKKSIIAPIKTIRY